jgi:hypothetical protein
MDHLLSFLFFFTVFIGGINAQNSSLVYLNETEQGRLQALYLNNNEVKILCDSIVSAANPVLQANPKPLKKIHFEGLLENNPDRVNTLKSLQDIDIVSGFVYAFYCTGDKKYLTPIKKYVLAWATTYKPDGNTINENKFVPLFWGYLVARSIFSGPEKDKAEKWITQIAQKQIERPQTPNNNWMAKRYRLIGLAGGITKNKEYIDFAVNGLKEYINTSYFPDGTSIDLKTRDAMHYHVGGIKVVLDAIVGLQAFSNDFNLYNYSGASGSSMAKTVEFTFPYATGEKLHREWVNTKVQFDIERAEAGLPEYQPGILFDKNEAISMFEYACYFDPKYYVVLSTLPNNYTATWLGLLNSPLVRD